MNKNTTFRFALLFILLLLSLWSYAQNDSLVFSNGNIVVGEVKSMDKGVLQIETDYSDSDFKIEWDKINYLSTETSFLMQLSNGEQYIGRLSSDSTGSVQIISQYNGIRMSDRDNIVFMRPVKKKFGDRFNASIEFGTNITKANRFKQYSSRLTSSYIAEKWSSTLQFSTLRSVQEDADTIRRTDGALVHNYFLPRNRYIHVSLNTLSNTEQNLDLRVNAKLGVGQYLVRTNSAYWGVHIGANRSYEEFSSETDNRASWEMYLGSELNLYDVGDFKLQSTLVAYPSITEKGRWRSDFTIDAKYEFDFDLFFRVGATVNYDGQPADGAETVDYVITTTLGWGW